MSMNVEAEIRDLKRRVAELEGSFGFSTHQVTSVAPGPAHLSGEDGTVRSED
jgi:hypothetical protein